jgi:hypothetical protein
MTPGKILHQAGRWYHTLRYLKWQQVWYRFWYPLKQIFYRDPEIPAAAIAAANAFPELHFPVYSHQSGIYDPSTRSFLLLNIRHAFGQQIDWDYGGYGRLWTYHLNYFDWLNDPGIAVADRLQTICDYLDAEDQLQTGKESYPSSLRIVNWIKFLSANNIREEHILKSLYRQSMRLCRFPEYQIQGNHLLENGITMMWISSFFDRHCGDTCSNIASATINAQILADGAHFERSIMYHAALLQKFYDLILLGRGKRILAYEPLYKLLSTNAAKMYSWLKAMQFSSGAYPCFGDCTPENCPGPGQLAVVEQDLTGVVDELLLGASGYRKMSGGGFELFFNCGKIGPDFQPGHAHADLFSFCLEYKGQPLISDTGVSTYEPGARREKERSTAAHNTLEVGGANSSDVWRSFRVGKRAVPVLTEDTATRITAVHDGYLAPFGVYHQRSIALKEGRLYIEDRLSGSTAAPAVIYLHLAPGLDPEPDGAGGLRIRQLPIRMSFKDIRITVETYEYCIGFNKRIIAKRIKGVLDTYAGITIIEPGA